MVKNGKKGGSLAAPEPASLQIITIQNLNYTLTGSPVGYAVLGWPAAGQTLSLLGIECYPMLFLVGLRLARCSNPLWFFWLFNLSFLTL